MSNKKPQSGRFVSAKKNSGSKATPSRGSPRGEKPPYPRKPLQKTSIQPKDNK